MTGPVFRLPAAPTGWERPLTQPVRIIDPRGDAIAWFAPELGGCCAGYAVRHGDGVARGDDTWRDIVVGSTAVPASGLVDRDGTPSQWQFVERDPASCTMERRLQDWEAGFWRMTASLADARLSLDVRVENPGVSPIRAGICLRLVLTEAPAVVTRSGHAAPERVPDNEGIVLSVASSTGERVVGTEVVGDVVLCTIADHQPRDATPVILPGAFRHLSVQIGLQRIAIAMEAHQS